MYAFYRNCQILALMCRKFDIPCVEIHSLMKQRLRIASLASFKSSQVKILFATDVASRLISFYLSVCA